MAAHVQTEKGARAAIEAGVASIEHGWVLTDEDLALAKKNRVVLVSTDFTVTADSSRAEWNPKRRVELINDTWHD